uniref:Protein kinase domain-containing protein n=1 Tax=Chromera velia CCMP2878 TaxID=1169474 RepID=A0A0G4GBA2_9ALVE|eukprot:Cvel_21061.t1-p1 / transcript=Cvel_21061.t1 / gene=Cvel_21061 / organism=Chromera_velia_CCMP2878 / gene_product=Calcium/calmodulin-dependent protein kinase type 1, putative / transcript_product=Calcium/calmodulin-dependent protein kinase type 1, putative / location=Cvel_scaffold1946:6778-9973(-) / protein_length=643 / sequence_SO=supercontig / SO=protein_coding / is_pseudo=false
MLLMEPSLNHGRVGGPLLDHSGSGELPSIIEQSASSSSSSSSAHGADSGRTQQQPPQQQLSPAFFMQGLFAPRRKDVRALTQCALEIRDDDAVTIARESSDGSPVEGLKALPSSPSPLRKEKKSMGSLLARHLWRSSAAHGGCFDFRIAKPPNILHKGFQSTVVGVTLCDGEEEEGVEARRDSLCVKELVAAATASAETSASTAPASCSSTRASEDTRSRAESKLDGYSESAPLSVVVKVIEKNRLTNTSDLIRAQQEVDFLRSLKHPHVLKMLDASENVNHIVMILEHAPHGDLYRLTRFRVMPEEDTRRMTHQVLLGLHFLHTNRRTAHCDIKPQNLLVFEEGGELIVKLCDFGMSQTMLPGRESFVFDGVRGTQGYIAPEILTQQDYGFKVDIWALGVIVFTLLAGYEPFYPASSCIKEKLQLDPEYWDAISPEGKDFVVQALKKDPRERISSHQALKHPWFTGSQAGPDHSRSRISSPGGEMVNHTQATQSLQLLHSLSPSGSAGGDAVREASCTSGTTCTSASSGGAGGGGALVCDTSWSPHHWTPPKDQSGNYMNFRHWNSPSAFLDHPHWVFKIVCAGRGVETCGAGGGEGLSTSPGSVSGRGRGVGGALSSPPHPQMGSSGCDPILEAEVVHGEL